MLIVRPGALGDTILALPLLESLAKKHPGAAFTFLGNPSYRELLPAGAKVQSIDSPDWLWLFSKNPHQAGVSIPAFNVAYVILQAPDVVVLNLRKAGTDSVRWITSRPAQGKHVVEHLHEGLGVPLPPREPLLAHLAGRHGQDVIWIHPGSGGARKCSPLNLIARMAQELACSAGLGLAVTVGEQDAFLKEMPGWGELVNHPGTALFEDRPLIEICEKLGSARLFIGNDSGISHLAAGLGIPSAVMFVGTDPVQWMPWTRLENLCLLDLREDRPSADILIARVQKFVSERISHS